MQLDELVEQAELFDPIERKRTEWLEKRRGKITCSQFGTLMSSGRAKDELFSQTGLTYLRRLVAERLGSWYAISAKAMEWGTENEPIAAEEYAKRTGYQVDSTPFQYYAFNDDIGGTPDGLVGTDGCIEIKCPYDPSVHVNTLLTRTVPKDYEWQVVGHLLVTGRSWCDFVSFDPRITTDEKLCVIRVERIEARIEELKKRLMLAVGEIEAMLLKIHGSVLA